MIKAMLSGVIVVCAMASCASDATPSTASMSDDGRSTMDEDTMPTRDELGNNPRFECAGVCIQGACPIGGEPMVGACRQNPGATCCSVPGAVAEPEAVTCMSRGGVCEAGRTCFPGERPALGACPSDSVCCVSSLP